MSEVKTTQSIDNKPEKMVKNAKKAEKVIALKPYFFETPKGKVKIMAENWYRANKKMQEKK